MIRLPQDACHELGALIDHLLTTVQLKQPLLAAKVACHRAKVIGRGRLQPKDGAHLVRNRAGTAHTAHVNEPRSVRIEPTDALRKTDREPRLAHPPGPSRVRRRVVPNAPRADGQECPPSHERRVLGRQCTLADPVTCTHPSSTPKPRRRPTHIVRAHPVNRQMPRRNPSAPNGPGSSSISSAQLDGPIARLERAAARCHEHHDHERGQQAKSYSETLYRGTHHPLPHR